MATVTINKKEVEKRDGVVILSLNEYKRLLEIAVPTYYLKGKAAKDLDKMVIQGMKDYKAGKTLAINSLADLD